MVAIRKCCCCLSLRQGTYMSAVYAIILSVIGVAVCAVLIHNANALVREAINEVEMDRGHEFTRETENFASTLVKVIYWIALVIYLLWFLTAILVFPALQKEKRGLLMPFLIFTCVLTGLCIFGILQNFTHLGDTFSTAASAVQFLLQLIIVGVNVYVIICLASFYKNNLREAHEVNALPVTSTVISAPAMATGPPPCYSYNYQPAPVGEDMEKKAYPANGYDYQQPPPVYGHDSMTQKI